MQAFNAPDSLALIAAPMVNQSDLPFRLLTRRHGATLAYTQMLSPHLLLNDQDYLEFHLRDIRAEFDGSTGLERPVVVQLHGNDPDILVKAARVVQTSCDGIDLNLGCPQEHAKDGHYGGYLLGKADWPLVEQIVSSMSNSLSIPVSTKIRLCEPSSLTPLLGTRLAAAGSSWITLHARHVNAKRRRAGAADLNAVKILKDTLVAEGFPNVPVISNGNVGTWEHILENRKETGADGIMVGEILLDNPCIFENATPDPVLISLEYLELCKTYPTASMTAIRTHIRHFVEHQCARRPWYPHFRAALNVCHTVNDVEALLRGKVVRWRGKGGATPLRSMAGKGMLGSQAEDDLEDAQDVDLSESVLF
ncbi:FMN-linked oxidoreductase [Athelia psychrophila]|uniref:tRNA-dihydrouridine(16/17) synthase [NAD(P)(+)] n=1 Tax=Athelia psychrophila TaxID=1759441 RepID=A0A166SD75_9AGAM|nr:FMN-linked oxidoreductase [Fibularhizoctonia sp. CBS 109695]